MSNKKSTNLSIVIPTHNRADFLDYSLEVHIPLAKKYNVSIYVVDNASTDNTAEIVAKWMGEYAFLYFSKNEKNLGPDLNFEIALNQPDTNYIWLLGDTSKIEENVFESVVQKSKDSYDLILLNSEQRVFGVNSQLIKDKKALLSTLGWHMTHMSPLIYSARIVESANFARFRDTDFIQVGIIFEYFSCREDVSVDWNQDLSITSLRKDGLKKVSWQKDAFDIWIKRWANFVLSLPPVYSLDSKLKMIQDHSNKSKIFSLRNLLALRAQGFYSMGHYFLYKKYFDIALGKASICKFLCTAVLPVKFVKFFIRIYKKSH